MRLLIIYGPPAVGKLTVADEVAKRTGFKVFHNHLSIDAILPVFEFGSEPFSKLVQLIRLETIAEAARNNVDLIFTFCFAKGVDEAYVEKVVAAARDNGGEVFFVLLTCDVGELKRRVVSDGRRQFRKVGTVGTIESFLETYDLFSPVPGTATLEIDNTEVSPDDVADRIVRHFGLERENG